MKNNIVIGLGYGDEGKGATVAKLAQANNEAVIVRFNGGQQAGHTVIQGMKRHVFSSIGAGSISGNPTYISRYCTISPMEFMNEFVNLRNLNIPTLRIYADGLCPITTPFDVYDNVKSDDIKAHGTCGMGFGSTIKRHEEKHGSYKLYLKDLSSPIIVAKKLEAIQNYYERILGHSINLKVELVQSFFEACHKLLANIIVVNEHDFFNSELINEGLIFEGAQGIMLDMDHGIFPNMTRSNTTTKNAREILKRNDLPMELEVKYVTRAYSTRHGNGYFPYEGLKENYNLIDLKNNELETCTWNQYQGKLRFAPLSKEILSFALKTDEMYGTKNDKCTLVVSCMDQIEDDDYAIVGYDGKLNIYSEGHFLHNMSGISPRINTIRSLKYDDTLLKSLKDDNVQV